MYPAELEKALETRLSNFGSPLGNRIYMRDIELAAKIDDLESPRKEIAQIKDPAQRADFEAVFLSDSQTITTEFDYLKFLRRSAYDDFVIQYWLESQNKNSSTEQNLDEIIKNRDYIFEGVQVYLNETVTPEKELINSCEWPGLVLFEIMLYEDGQTDAYNRLEDYPGEEDIIELSKKYGNKISQIHRYFNSVSRSPREIAEAITTFTEMSKDKT